MNVLAIDPPSSEVVPTDQPLDPRYLTRQDWSAYTDSDHQVWRQLVARRMDTLPETASRVFLEGLETIGLSATEAPDLAQVNRRLEARTGWRALPVTGFLPPDQFFRALAERQFPTTITLRSPDSLDYTSEPDMFHDVFGHVPLHAHPVFADFLQRFGALAATLERPEDLRAAGNLFWFSVEFGLLREDGPGVSSKSRETKIYGSGLISSRADAANALGPGCDRRPFDLDEVIAQEVDTGRIQEVLFVVESFDQLFEAVRELEGRFGRR